MKSQSAQEAAIRTFLDKQIAKVPNAASVTTKEAFNDLRLGFIYTQPVIACIERMVVALYEAGQTEDEKVNVTVTHRNGIGFSGTNVKRLSFYAKWVSEQGKGFSQWMAFNAAKKIRIHARQLAALAPQYAEKPVSKPVEAPVAAPAPIPASTPTRTATSAPRLTQAHKMFGRVNKLYTPVAKKRPCVLVDGVNTASEVKFLAALDKLRAGGIV